MLRDGVENVVQELVGDIGTCTTLIEPGGQRTFITTEGVESEPQLEDLEILSWCREITYTPPAMTWFTSVHVKV